jgi:hypothetical protein
MRRPPDMKGSCEHIEYAKTGDKGCPPAWGLGKGLTVPYCKKITAS